MQFDAALSYSAIDNERRGRLDDPFDAVGALEEQRDFSEWVVGTGVRWQPAEAWSVDVGIEGRFQEADYAVAMDSRFGALADPLQAAPSLHRAVDAERDGTLFTGYLSARQQFAGGLRLEYGFRYDLQDIDPVHDVQFSPRLQLTFERPRWQTFVNIGRYTQHQSLYELQVDDGLLELQEPQVSDQLSAGIDWLATQRLHVRLESYWRRVRDPRARFENIYNRWVLLPELHADRLRVDPSRVHTYGGEVAFEYQYDDGLRAFLSLAAAHARERLDGDWRSRPWAQHGTLRAGVDWRPGTWQIGVIATWHGGWPTTSRQEEPLTTTARLYDRSLPDYFSLDLHLARTVALPKGDLEVYFDLSNATVEDHVGGYRYEPTPEGIRADERMLLPGVPVLGIEWRW